MTAWRRKRYHEAHNDGLYAKFAATSFGHRITVLLVFSVTSFKMNQNQNQNQNSSIDKVQNLEKKEGKYAKTLAKIQVTVMFLTPDMRRNCVPKFMGIFMETPCWCPYGWAPAWRLHTNLYKFG